jgi:hypothetical protein
VFQEASAGGFANPDPMQQTQYQNQTAIKEMGVLDRVISAEGLGD